MKSVRTLLLEKKQVEKLISMKDAVRAVEEGFREYGKGRAVMPSKIYLNLPEFSGDFRAMPSYLPKTGICTLKWVNAHVLNWKKGLPAVMAVVLISDPRTGFPLCVMDGTHATNLRTGAAGAVAVKYLARKDSRVLGLVGCGVQARTQLEAIREVRPIRSLFIWGPDPSEMKRFSRDVSKYRIPVTLSASIEACVRSSDILVTVTPSRRPIVKEAWIKPGTHINAIGADAPGKQELDPEILRRAKIVVDAWEQAAHGGEINAAVRRGILKRGDIYAELGELAAGRKKGRVRAGEITVFDSTGLAIQDTAIASVIYRNAVKRKIGRWVRLVG